MRRSNGIDLVRTTSRIKYFYSEKTPKGAGVLMWLTAENVIGRVTPTPCTFHVPKSAEASLPKERREGGRDPRFLRPCTQVEVFLAMHRDPAEPDDWCMAEVPANFIRR